MIKIGVFNISYTLLIMSFIMCIFNMFNCYVLFILAIIIHELLHCIIGILYGLKVQTVYINLFGCKVEFFSFSNIQKYKKVIILFSGPCINIIMGVIILLFGNEFLYIFAFSNLVLGFFNLLPLYPLDGGKILFLFIRNMFIIRFIQNIFIVFIITICSYFLINYNSILMFLTGIYIVSFISFSKRKIIY